MMQIEMAFGTTAGAGCGERPIPPMRREPGIPPRVLLAEDDPAMRALVAAVLQADGCEVVEARDLEHLADVVAGYAEGPDSIAMIISDIRMPGLSGLELLAALRAARWSTPVLLITAFGSDETHAEATQLGAIAVLDKPFSLERLRALVRRTIAAQ